MLLPTNHFVTGILKWRCHAGLVIMEFIYEIEHNYQLLALNFYTETLGLWDERRRVQRIMITAYYFFILMASTYDTCLFISKNNKNHPAYKPYPQW